MGATPVYNLPYPEVATDPPNGPAQISALALGVEGELVRVDATAAGQSTQLAQFMNSALLSAPIASTSQTGYPFGLSVYNTTTGDGWPANGILVVHRYSTNTRVMQEVTRTGAACQRWARNWDVAGSAWTPWVELSAPPFSKAGVELITFASASSHIRTISFGTTFTAAPAIVIPVISSASGDAGGWSMRTDTYTTTNFRLIMTNPVAVAWTNIPLLWYAVGPH